LFTWGLVTRFSSSSSPISSCATFRYLTFLILLPLLYMRFQVLDKILVFIEFTVFVNFSKTFWIFALGASRMIVCEEILVFL
jgi:hypothetical protein